MELSKLKGYKKFKFKVLIDGGYAGADLRYEDHAIIELLVPDGEDPVLYDESKTNLFVLE